MERKEAKELGLKHYDNGKPCKTCGTSVRHTSSYSCVKCNVDRNKHKLYDKELMAKYRTKEKKKVWLDANADRVKEIKRKSANKPESIARRKQYYQDNKDKWRNYQLDKDFGISQEIYEQMLDNQGGCCMICGVDACPTGKSFAVDHDHETGKVRGLLCKNCNIGLGMFFDNAELLHSAARYLEETDE